MSALIRSKRYKGPPETLTVFYDGSCPLCRSEVAFYQKKKSVCHLNYVDVSIPKANLPRGLDRQNAMARFHVLSEKKGLVSGARAFSELWKQIPNWKAAGHLTSLPGISFLCEGLYRFFLVLRPYFVKLFLTLDRSKNH